MASFQELAWLTFLSVGSLIAAKVNTEIWLTIDAIITIFFAVVTIPFAAESQQMQVMH